MRSFQNTILLLFMAVFFLSVLGSFLNLRKILSQAFTRNLGLFFLLVNVGVLFGLFILYIYPFNARLATSFPLYFYFNTILLSLLLFNLPMSLAWLIQCLFGGKGSQPVISQAGLVLALGLAVSMLYGTFVGSRQLVAKKVDLTFENLPGEFDNFRIVQLSDFHLGGMLKPERLLKKVRKKVEGLNPGLILFTGDLVNNFATEGAGLEKYLRDISGLADSYSILGNHDYGDYTRWESPEKKEDNFNAIVESQRYMGFRLLRNEHVVLRRGGDSLFLAGVENWGHPPFPQYARLEVALDSIPPGAFTILMTHDPSHWESRIAGKEDAGLTLSGHTHGMQWGVKLAGIPFSVAYLARKTWSGIYGNSGQVLYVNTGLGTVGIPWRLDMPGEITLITLKRSKVD